jgi:hypothetical protein
MALRITPWTLVSPAASENQWLLAFLGLLTAVLQSCLKPRASHTWGNWVYWEAAPPARADYVRAFGEFRKRKAVRGSVFAFAIPFWRLWETAARVFSPPDRHSQQISRQEVEENSTCINLPYSARAALPDGERPTITGL